MCPSSQLSKVFRSCVRSIRTFFQVFFSVFLFQFITQVIPTLSQLSLNRGRLSHSCLKTARRHDTDLYSPRIHFSSKSIRKRFNAIFGYSVRSDTAECYSTWQWERHGLKIKSRMVESLRRDKNRYSLPPLQEPKEKQSLMCLISWMYYSDRSISILRNQSTLERKYITNCKVHCERSPFFKLNLPIDMFVLICLWG